MWLQPSLTWSNGGDYNAKRFKAKGQSSLIESRSEMIEDIGRGRGVYISTYGCQMNENDTERMLSLLEMVNFVPVESPEKATLIIINSCSVREKPVHKVWSEVGKYKELKTKNPDLKICLLYTSNRRW